uniref:Ribosome receptor lysine/proline rich domain-containing protein n=1 Tax=Amphiprion ocellaris TaxID=80972 RepID=A0A3Q1AR09_AMPOC
MDIYDPQTLGIMVFGGFMVISALGIALVSTFSMKETSYEEALAKQRRELGKIQSVRSDKKKKDKVSEKKSRGKKKEEKPNGKIPEQEKAEDAAEADGEADVVDEPAAADVVVDAAPAPVPEAVAASEAKSTAAPAAVETQAKTAAEPVADPSPVPSPKDKKKKKVAKVEPASTRPAPVVSAPAAVKSSAAPAAVKSSAAPAVNQVPASAPAKAAVPAAAPAPAKSAPTSAKSAPASAKSAPAPVSAKSSPTTAKSAPSAAPASSKSAPATSKSAPAPAKSAAAPAKAASAPVKTAPVLEAVTKDVPVMAVPPVGSQQAPAVAAKAQEPKKKASKKKSEPAAAVDSADAPLYLPYKALVSTISSMVFSEGEAHRLIEILSEKVGIIQDTWHTATQKGDPVAMLKKQLEEREKQLAAEQEDASAVKNRLRELTKELSAEKSKVASVETRLSAQLSKREQEMIALQARMQASYQDHVKLLQLLQILSLQDQLEKGPNAQLARLQQENSILRDALNQATSQAESKQNAELAKLRQECAKLTKELGEKSESLLADEHVRKGLEAKVSTTEKQLSLLQASHAESEQALQRRLEEVCEELRTSQSRNSSLQATLDKTQQETSTLSEADVIERSAQVDALTAQLEETQAEKSQLVQQVASINSLLEASQNKEEVDNTQVKHSSSNTEAQLAAFQTETKETLQTLFPQIPVETEQFHTVTIYWLELAWQKVLNVFGLFQELLEKLKEAEESHGTLQAECEQYRTVLAETEGMLKHLQQSVEEEELVWKSKMANSEEQLNEVKLEVGVLDNTGSMCGFNEIEERHFTYLDIYIYSLYCCSYNSACLTCVAFFTLHHVQLKLQLSEGQRQLESVQKEAQAHKEELAQVTLLTSLAFPILLCLPIFIYDFRTSSLISDPLGIHTVSFSLGALKSHLLSLLEQERLEKEKKLSKDLGQAATKLQQLLKATQEQLTKERDTVRTLQEHLEGKGEYVELKEGTSV